MYGRGTPGFAVHHVYEDVYARRYDAHVLKLTFGYNGQKPVEGKVLRAEQRCKAITGWDGESDAATHCGATRHAHMIGPWECGHDDDEGVLIVEVAGGPGELTFPTGDGWASLLVKAGL